MNLDMQLLTCLGLLCFYIVYVVITKNHEIKRLNSRINDLENEVKNLEWELIVEKINAKQSN